MEIWWARIASWDNLKRITMEKLKAFQNWYFNHCDGEWEHQHGIRIGTIDNPGWRIEINLFGTKLENIVFKRIEIEKNENDWIHCWVENKTFNAACGPLNLEEVLGIFLEWVQKN